MNRRPFPGLLLLSALFMIAPALAAADGGHSTVKRKHVYEDDRSSESDNINIIGIQGALGLASASMNINSAQAGAVAQPGQGANATTNSLPVATNQRSLANFGAYYEHRFVPTFGLRGEINYVTRGFSIGAANEVSTEFSMNYLEVPLLAKAQKKFGIFTPFAAFGPFMGLAVSKGGNDVAPGGGLATPINVDNGFNGFNFGLCFGGGVDIEFVRNVNFEIAARYSMGLVNVLTAAGQQYFLNGQPVGPNSTISAQLNDLQFLSGVSLSL